MVDGNVDLPRASALDSGWIQGVYGTTFHDTPPVWFAERTGLAMVQVNCARAIAATEGRIAAKVVGATTPPEPLCAAVGRYGVLMWTGPGRWFAVREGSDGQKLEAEFVQASRQLRPTDLSHGRTVIRAGGPRVRDLLAKGCHLDLHPRSFVQGGCAQTMIAETSVLLHCIGAGDAPADTVFDLYVPRGYAMHFQQCIAHAAEEFGYEVRAST